MCMGGRNCCHLHESNGVNGEGAWAIVCEFASDPDRIAARKFEIPLHRQALTQGGGGTPDPYLVKIWISTRCS